MSVIKILEFENDKKTYAVLAKDNNLLFGHIVDGVFKTNLFSFEENTIKKIYSLIVGENTDLIKLSTTQISNELITFFYNPNNHLYSFLKYENNKHVKPDINTIYKLNNIFNNQEGVLYENGNTVYKDYIKILVSHGSKIIPVFVLSSLLLSYLPSIPTNNTLFKVDYAIDNMYKNPNMMYDNTNYSFDDIKASIDSNPNLSDEEKEFLYNLQPEIEENIDYIDIEKLKYNLASLDINYNSVNFEEKLKQNVLIDYNVSGSYTYMGVDKNKIDLYPGIYNLTGFNDSDKATLIHEVNHLVNNRSALLSINGVAGNFIGSTYKVFDVEANPLNELVNEMFSREYAVYYDNEYDFNGYNVLMPIMYMLAEIVDSDTLRRYKFNSDDYYLNNYFASIGVEDRYTYSLYKDLKLYSDKNLSKEEKQVIADEITNIIKYMYEKKYNKNMEDDLIMLAYLYNSEFSNDYLNKKFTESVNMDNIFEVSPKGYFASKAILNNSSVLVYEYSETDSNKIGYVIDNNNRYIENSKRR